MRRTIVYLLICMPLCLLLVPDRSPIALSLPQDPQDRYTDDGKGLPDEARFAKLAAEDPCAALDACLKRQHREVQRYSGVLHKTERMKDKLHEPEVIEFWFQENPYSVLMKWRQGSRGAKASLYVQGRNKDQITIVSDTRIPLTLDFDMNSRRIQDG